MSSSTPSSSAGDKDNSTSGSNRQFPLQLLSGATRYQLVDLGEAGSVYIPSLALQRRPLPMAHTWRPRVDKANGSYQFVNLADRGCTVYQLPDCANEFATNLAAHSPASLSSISKKSDTTAATAAAAAKAQGKTSSLLSGDESNSSNSNGPFHLISGDEVVAREKLKQRHFKEWLKMVDDFRDDCNVMVRLERAQINIIEQQTRAEIDKTMREETARAVQRAEKKMKSRRDISELLGVETMHRSDIRYTQNHELMQLREQEARDLLAARTKTRLGAAGRYQKFERVAVCGVEEIQRDVMLRDEAVARGKLFLAFSRARLGSYMQLRAPVPGSDDWTPWAQDVRLENCFVATADFGILYSPKDGEAVNRAWYANTQRPADTAAELMSSARVDACALLGDFCLGLAELFRLFVKPLAMHSTALSAALLSEAAKQQEVVWKTRRKSKPTMKSALDDSGCSSAGNSSDNDDDEDERRRQEQQQRQEQREESLPPFIKLRWLDAQNAIDGAPLSALFPSSLARSTELQLIDVLRNEESWKDRALATAMGVQRDQQRRREKEQREKVLKDQLAEMESSQVRSHDHALGRHTRRFPHSVAYTRDERCSVNYNNNNSSNSISKSAGREGSHQFQQMAAATTPPLALTPDEFELLQSMRLEDGKRKLGEFQRSLLHSPADAAAERLQLIRAIKLGEVLSDKDYDIHHHHNFDSDGLNNSRGAPVSSAAASSSSKKLPQQHQHRQTPFLDASRKALDWSQIKDEADSGGLRWDAQSSRGIVVRDDGTRAIFDPTHSQNTYRPYRIAPAFCIGGVGVSTGIFVWQVVVRISGYKKFAGTSPTFKVGFVSRFFGPSMEQASQRNSVLAGLSFFDNNSSSSGASAAERAMSYFVDERGSLFCGSSGIELKKVADSFCSPLKDGSAVTCVLDLDRYFLQFFVDGKTPGVAFRFSPPAESTAVEPLFPCVAFAAVGDEATLVPPDAAVIAALSLAE